MVVEPPHRRLTDFRPDPNPTATRTRPASLEGPDVFRYYGVMKPYTFRIKPGGDLKHEIERFAHENGVRAGFIVTCVGGHLKEGSIVHPTAEIVIGEDEGVIYARETDAKTGFTELVAKPR